MPHVLDAMFPGLTLFPVFLNISSVTLFNKLFKNFLLELKCRVIRFKEIKNVSLLKSIFFLSVSLKCFVFHDERI